jgi:hypothetical protein
MYNVLVKLIVLAALIELGMSFKDIDECSSRTCLDRIQKASQQVLRIDWKSISVFPGEASRFKQSTK